MARTAHRRLLAYQLARDLAADAMTLSRALPPGYEALRSQVDRAALASLRRIADGANADAYGSKIASYVAARGDVAELEASLDAVELLGLGHTDLLRARAGHAADMLTGLVDGLDAAHTV